MKVFIISIVGKQTLQMSLNSLVLFLIIIAFVVSDIDCTPPLTHNDSNPPTKPQPTKPTNGYFN